jgi:hypothetical protein
VAKVLTQPQFRYLNIITGVFVTILVLVPSVASKFIAVGPFNLSGATLFFPLTYVFNDLLTEVYGYARSRQIIWTGLCCQVLAACMYWLITVWPSASFWHNQTAFETILGLAPRVTVASLSAYFCGEFLNSVVLSKLKYRQKGAVGLPLAGRFLMSTIVGEAIDTVIFLGVGFWGTMATSDLLITMVTVYIAKVIYEILALPMTMHLCSWLKKVEGVDKIDSPSDTTYSPFAMDW